MSEQRVSTYSATIFDVLMYCLSGHSSNIQPHVRTFGFCRTRLYRLLDLLCKSSRLRAAFVPRQEQCVVNVLQPGNALKCAGYCLYSCSTILVLTIGHGVYGFTVDPLIGEFVLTHRDIKIPEVSHWLPAVAD